LRKAKTDGVTPAKAGVQGEKNWIPASAGMTNTVSATVTIYFLLCFSISSQFLVFFCVYCWRNNSALFYIVRVVTSRNEYQISEFDKDVEVGSGK